jgi:hypothetical protein
MFRVRALLCPEIQSGASTPAIGFTFAPSVFGIAPAISSSSASGSTASAQDDGLSDVSCPYLQSLFFFDC